MTNTKSEMVKIIIVYAIELAIMIGSSVVFSTVGTNIPFIVQAIVIYALLVAPVIIYSIKDGNFTAESFGFKKIKVSTIFLTVLLTLVCSPMCIFANLLSQLVVPNIVIQSFDEMMDGSMVGLFIIMAVLAPICEEIICRGFFQNRLSKLLPFLASAVVSGFMFGLLHLNLNQFCYALVLGIILAYVNRASGSVFTSMLMHILFNAGNVAIIALGSMALAAQDIDMAELAENTRTDKTVMLAGIIFYGVLAVISFFLTRLVIKAIAKREGTYIIEEEFVNAPMES